MFDWPRQESDSAVNAPDAASAFTPWPLKRLTNTRPVNVGSGDDDCVMVGSHL